MPSSVPGGDEAMSPEDDDDDEDAAMQQPEPEARSYQKKALQAHFDPN